MSAFGGPNRNYDAGQPCRHTQRTHRPLSLAYLRLLFFATTINYVDRQALCVLAPEHQKIIG